MDNENGVPKPIGEVHDLNEGRLACRDIVALVSLAFWILIVTFGVQSTSWGVLQAAYEFSYINYTRGEFIIQIVYAAALLIPLGIASRGKGSRFRSVVRTWLWAAIFALVLAPLRLLRIEQTQLGALIQVGGALVYASILLLWQRRTARGRDFEPISLGDVTLSPAILAAAFLGIPWVLWGALGSPTDVLLNLAAGLALGVAVGLTLALVPQHPAEEGMPGGRQMLWHGSSVAVFLLIAATAYGMGGMQWVLSLALPGLGWGLVALPRLSARADTPGGWIPAALLSGLAAAFPMAFLDPMELSLIITGDPGELIQWAVRASLLTLTFAALASITLSLLAGRRRKELTASPTLGGLAGLAWAGALAIYLFAGQTGFYGERLFVVLKDQADVSSAEKIQDYTQRRTYVYKTLVQHAEQTQSRLRDALLKLGLHYTPYYLVNGLEVQAEPLVRLWLESQPEVDRILNDPILRPLPAPIPEAKGDAAAPNGVPWNLKAIGADRVWTELGVTGKGIVVGQSDSGVDGSHPEIEKNYRGYGSSDQYNWLDPWNNSPHPVDINGHGTHTLALVVGEHTGVAPGAQWIACVNLARNLGNPSDYLNCMQFMLAPFPQGGDPFRDGDPSKSAEVLNNSWGCPPIEGCDANALLPAVKALQAAGIFVVASTGNAGLLGCGTVTDPLSIYAQAFSVGAIDDRGSLADFSSLGPVRVDGSNRVKPDIVAPGVDVVSAFPQDSYMSLSGTSMAGPHVAGTVALMWSANPALIGDIERTDQILAQSASAYQGPYPQCVDSRQHPNDAVGYGVLDAYQAVKMALSLK